VRQHLLGIADRCPRRGKENIAVDRPGYPLDRRPIEHDVRHALITRAVNQFMENGIPE
jgi:hypothetical protein